MVNAPWLTSLSVTRTIMWSRVVSPCAVKRRCRSAKGGSRGGARRRVGELTVGGEREGDVAVGVETDGHVVPERVGARGDRENAFEGRDEVTGGAVAEGAVGRGVWRGWWCGCSVMGRVRVGSVRDRGSVRVRGRIRGRGRARAVELDGRGVVARRLVGWQVLELRNVERIATDRRGSRRARVRGRAGITRARITLRGHSGEDRDVRRQGNPRKQLESPFHRVHPF